MTKTRNFADVIRKKLAKDEQLKSRVDEESLAADIAMMIYEARTKAGLTQTHLADLVGTHQTVIARLENANYTGHSLSMIRRIATALNMRVAMGLHHKPEPISETSVSANTVVAWTTPTDWTTEFEISGLNL